MNNANDIKQRRRKPGSKVTRYFGTVESLDGNRANVLLDGNTLTTPCVNQCMAAVGDNVSVDITDHKAVVTSTGGEGGGGGVATLALASYKASVFLTDTIPTPPYALRDLLFSSTGGIRTCVQARAAGETAVSTDWLQLGLSYYPVEDIDIENFGANIWTLTPPSTNDSIMIIADHRLKLSSTNEVVISTLPGGHIDFDSDSIFVNGVAIEDIGPTYAYHGSCSTAAGTATKVATCAGFDLADGNILISVTFTYAPSQTNPTLNVNATGAKSIYYRGSANLPVGVITAGSTHLFQYDTALGVYRWLCGDSAEYVVTGTNGSWDYSKYSNGKITAKRTLTASCATTSLWASPIYFGSVSLSMPSGMFNAAPTHVLVTIQGEQLVWQIGTTGKTATAITVYFARASNATTDITFTVELEGTWK